MLFYLVFKHATSLKTENSGYSFSSQDYLEKNSKFMFSFSNTFFLTVFDLTLSNLFINTVSYGSFIWVNHSYVYIADEFTYLPGHACVVYRIRVLYHHAF